MQFQKFLFFLILLFGIGSISAQESVDSTLITKINIQGNNRTKSEIIIRELTIEAGLTYSNKELPKLIEQNRLQILKTSLFNFAEITIKQIDNTHTELTISVQERWYYIPRIRIKTVEENINAWFNQKDLNHITTALMITDENFRGHNEKFTLSGSLGYNKSIGVAYFKPSIFRLTHLGIGADFQWNSNKEALYGLFDYKPEYYRSNSSDLINNIQGSLQLYYRPTIAIDELFTISYQYTHFHDSLIAKNKMYYPNQEQQLIRLASKLKIDFRDNKAYPLTGCYFDLIAEKAIDINRSNKQTDFNLITVNARFYKHLYKNLFGAIGGSLIANSSTDYFPSLTKSIGQSGLEIRSFEQYLLPIQKAAIVRSTLKYRLIYKPKQVLPSIYNPKFSMIHYALYATLFADGATLDLLREANYEQQLSINNKFLYTVGAGLDFSTYYDLVFRTEYSYNFVLKKYVFAIHFKSSI